MTELPLIEVTDRIRVPKKLIPAKDIKKRYHITLYQEDKCAKCSNLEDRSPSNELCRTCPAFHGDYTFFRRDEARKGIWSLPQADETAIKRLLKKRKIKHEWVDNRVVKKMRSKLKFTGSLYKAGDVDEDNNPRPDQVSAVSQWLKKKIGVIQAPPRSGKTVIATYLTCELGVRTVVVAHQKELLSQFYETFTGVNPPQYRLRPNDFLPSTIPAQRKAVTNARQIQDETGRVVVFMPKSYGQLRAFLKKNKYVPDVLLITYQSFKGDKNEKRIANILNKYYSFIIVDEEHTAGATEYLRFCSRLDTKWRAGLSATPDRKDRRSDLTARVFGPVVSTVDTTTLRPNIVFKPSVAVPRADYKTWSGAFKWLVHNPKRNKEIVQQVFKDLRAGHSCILIPVDYKAHVAHLVKMINHQAKVNYTKRGENWPTELAKAFHAGLGKKRGEVLNWVDTYEDGEDGIVHDKLPTRSPRVLVAVRSMVKQGIDLKRPSALYVVMPMSANKAAGAPMFRQMSYRVCTPYKGKPEPLVRVWIDQVNMFRACVSGLLWNEIFPSSTLKKKVDATYKLTPEQYEVAKTRSAKVDKKKRAEVSNWW